MCGRVVSKIYSSTLILTCLWTSKRVLTKPLDHPHLSMEDFNTEQVCIIHTSAWRTSTQNRFVPSFLFMEDFNIEQVCVIHTSPWRISTENRFVPFIPLHGGFQHRTGLYHPYLSVVPQGEGH